MGKALLKRSRFGTMITAIVNPSAELPMDEPVTLSDSTATGDGLVVEPLDFVELAPVLLDLLDELARLLAKEKPAIGRPSKLTVDNVRTLVTAIVIGATYKDACESVGIWHETFLQWIRESDADTSGKRTKYDVFSELVKQANGICAVRYTQILSAAAETQDAKYALEWLKRRRKVDWGDNVDLTSKEEKIEFIVKYEMPKVETE